MNRLLYILAWPLLLFTLNSCKKENEPTPLPDVQTFAVDAIDYTSARVSVKITREGSSVLGATGVVVGTKANPTLLDRIIPNTQVGVGDYSLTVNQLLEGTTYHIRAYATNLQGTAYGENRTITTLRRGTPVIVIDSIVRMNNLRLAVFARVVSDSGSAVQRVYGFYSYNENMTDIVDIYGDFDNGIIRFNLKLSKPLTRTYIQIYAQNSIGVGSATSSAITGPPENPIISSISLSEIRHYNNYVIGASDHYYGTNLSFGVQSNGSILSRIGICYGNSPNLTLSTARKVLDAKPLGREQYEATFLYDLVTTPKTYYYRSFVQYGDTTIYGTEYTKVVSGFPSPYNRSSLSYICRVPIFYLAPDGSAKNRAPYGVGDISYEGARSTTNGRANTNFLNSVLPQQTITAASVCGNLVAYGYDDWYLPAQNQLSGIAYNSNIFSVRDGLSGDIYWSSTSSSTPERAMWLRSHIYYNNLVVNFENNNVTYEASIICVR